MRLIALVLSLLATPVLAHEYWIEPEAYQVDPNTMVTAHLVNGQNFDGGKQAYIPQRFVHFVMIHDGKIIPVRGRVGDSPALQMESDGDGLHVVAYQANNATVDYENWEKFQGFVEHKDLGDVRSRHDARGLPDVNFVEVYSRYSKSLIGVGSGAGSDSRTGLETEFVALTNPYVGEAAGGMRLQLYYRQDVRANTQVEIFEKGPDGAVAVSYYMTDGNGIATIPTKPGFEYMADSVVLREPAEDVAAQYNAVWETLWANITWKMP